MESGTVYIGLSVFDTLLAISAEEQAHGLMHQEWPPPIMSFIYAKPQVNRFWMHQTPSPLDIVFCCRGKVSQLHVGEPYSTKIIGDEKDSDLIIEFPRGTIDTAGIKIGYSVGLVQPTPEELRKIIAKKHHQFIKP